MAANTASPSDFEASSSMIESGALMIASFLSEEDYSDPPVWAWVSCWAVTTLGAWLATYALAASLL